MRKKNNRYTAEITVGGQTLPVAVVLEQRHGHRYSITRRNITMRLPHNLSTDEMRRHLQELQNWVQKVAAQKTTLLTNFVPKTYQTGDVLRVGKRQYRLEVHLEARNSHTGRLVGDTICLRLSEHATPANRSKATKTLLSRIVAGDFQREIEQRVAALNQRSVNRPINGVFLKYNFSNWGSCSVNGNVNLSTRLLFAPEDVQDYVILHELAHLVELNHSERFWALVEKFMPDYREKEIWLKKNGANCDF